MMKLILGALVSFATVGAFAAAETYKVDTKASSITWKGTKKMGSFHTGGIAFKDGTVSVEKNKVVGADLVVDMKTITNTDIKDAKDSAKLVGHLSSPDFFDVAKNPTSAFKVTSVTPGKKAGEMVVKGQFTMIGQTQPVEFPATLAMEKGTLTGDAVVKIDRTKWGLKYGSGNIFKELTADKIINDEIELTLKIVAAK